MKAIKRLIDSYNGLCALMEIQGMRAPDQIDFEQIKNNKSSIQKAIDEYEEMLDAKESMSGQNVAYVYRNMVKEAKDELEQMNHEHD